MHVCMYACFYACINVDVFVIFQKNDHSHVPTNNHIGSFFSEQHTVQRQPFSACNHRRSSDNRTQIYQYVRKCCRFSDIYSELMISILQISNTLVHFLRNAAYLLHAITYISRFDLTYEDIDRSTPRWPPIEYNVKTHLILEPKSVETN